jgi:cell division protein FtsL
MNTAIRVATHGRSQSTFPLLHINRPRLINLILLAMLLASAFTVVYIKDLNRRLFIQYQALQAKHEKLYQDWGKLLLEQSTWSRQARVRQIAQQRLGMCIPLPDEIVILRARHIK